VTGGSRGTERVEEREHVRPSVTHAEEVLANTSGENFPIAFRALPAKYRKHLFALYCFARFTDDLGDQAKDGQTDDGQTDDGHTEDSRTGTKQLRLKLLDDLQADIDRIYAGERPLTPALSALVDTVTQCGVPKAPFDALIQANRQDQVVGRYATYKDLEQYCTLSANPVGEVVLYIFGAATDERIKRSNDVCTALQLVEHWQDVAEDYAADRIYLPQDDMARFGVTEQDLAQTSANDNVKSLLCFETKRATAILDDGAPLVGTLRGAARLAVAGYVAGGRAAIAAIERHGYNVLAATPRQRKSRFIKELAMTYLRGR
jgi:squalene synthase HpnC